ncbi:hypothetical protein SAMN06309944_0682 [Micrococcales bacterium KH10]|nr:hypothetical protein SAMN06309944_0682 [Micrococcales bacterium KH10]
MLETRARRVAIRVAAAAGAALLTVGLAVTSSPAAHAAANVTIVNEFGKAEADLTYATKVTVSGTGFQSVQGGFGGIYVMFGWVNSASWKPSQGGTTTNGDYLYVPDEETKDNAGYQRFVAFPGSNTEDAANGGTIAADGSWSTEMYIPGPTFQAIGRGGGTSSVDCREVTCGILTIGAHGVVNQNNETFTPISFANIYDTAPAAEPAPTNEPQEPTTEVPGTTTEVPGTATDPNIGAADTGEATITVNRDTAVVGRVLAFTASGFVEGEQVVVVLDDGVAAVGPLTTGRAGTLAGAIQLPASVRMGTHSLTISGAASGRTATVNFPVRSNPAEAAAAQAATDEEAGSSWPSWLPEWPILVFVGVALVAFVLALMWRLKRRRKANGKNEPKPATAPQPATGPVPQPAAATPAPPAASQPAAAPAHTSAPAVEWVAMNQPVPSHSTSGGAQ